MPLQKSLSEQNGSSRERQLWQRSKSHSSVNASRTTPHRPLDPVSETSKTKLHAFEFRPPAQLADDQHASAPKEGAGIEQNRGVENTPTKVDARIAKTPVGKLAWQDLVGMPDVKEDDDDISPNDRITWDAKRTGSYRISPVISRRRGKKRARSSSPTSSPATDSKPTTPAVNIKELSQALKSNHTDPALELWDRFSLSGSTVATPLGPSNPALAQIMVSSSPQPSRVVSGAARAGIPLDMALRRTVSCGANWPKRRRADRTDFRPAIGTVLEDSPTEGSKSSMVNALLKSVDGEISRSEAAQSHNATSKSPSEAQGQYPNSLNHSVGSKSPPPRRHPPPPLFCDTPSKGGGVRATERKNTGISFEGTSDYEDEDLDEDLLMELDVNIAPACNVQGTETAQQQADVKIASTTKQSSFDDEFDDLDEDIFAAAEEMMAGCNGPNNNTGEDVCGPHTIPQNERRETVDDAYGDDFGADFDFEAAELAATQTAKQTSGTLPPDALKPRAIQRYRVTNVMESQYMDESSRQVVEKILFVQVEESKLMKAIHLRGDWIDTAVSPESFVHVIGEFEPSGQCIIDNNQNILILHPDQLISATVVADSFTCMRRAVLQDRVKATSEASPPLVYGTLLHEIFQEAMMSNQWTINFLDGLIVKITDKHVEDLYKIKVSVADAREHLRSKMTELRSWAAAFVAPYPRPDAIVQDRQGNNATMCVTKLLDVEEHVWSPIYGLKGNIDATVQVTMREGSQRRTLTIPFEVKTGKNETTNHRAQTALYNLLLSDRYDIEIAYGVLYYMESSRTIRIPTIRHELRHMIMQRNQLACFIRERSVKLPPMKRSTNTCGNCYAKVPCFIYHKLADDGDGETSGLKGKFDEVVKHLSSAHQEFFLKWEDLLTKEERESQKLRRELWTMLSTEREKVGRCFANVVIEDGSAVEENHNPKINRYKYTFVKDNAVAGFSFLDSQLAVGEPIVVSDEQGHFALALGYVTSVRKQRISVAVDRRLHNARIRRSGFDEANNQVFAGIMEVAPEGATQASSQGKLKEAPIRYRLDKDEFSNGMATVRNNLVQIMADDVFGSREIRRIVVDLVPPTFKAASTQYTIRDQESLNVDQRRAIEKVMSAKDYALVLGMPGTGKTTTIAHIIRALVSQGKSVLLTSYTHSAVDNILLKLKNDKTPILRLGAPAKAHPEVQDFAILAAQPMNSFEEIHSAWHDSPIVATTCLGVNHPLFNERTFDYCIVDEASQITLPICLGPIRLARTFVLVGDHNQLPPLVQNEEARHGGLDISLFKLLSDTHPGSVVNLEHQYRMCEDVMTLSNTLIYNGRLKCGTESLRNSKLEIPHMEALRHKHYDASTVAGRSSWAGVPRSFCTSWSSSACWLHSLLDPEARVRFVNTDALPDCREEAKGNRIVNPTEANIVAQIVDALVTVGVSPAEIGVMTHYRSQLSLLKHNLRGHGPAIELHTADRFQGRDKEVVVLSLVRSNEHCSIGELLKDWRRINVAFTRAKTKLLVIGSRKTLRDCGESEMVSQFVRLMEERDWVYDLPGNALESHLFDSGFATQATATGAGAAGTQATVKSIPAKKTSIKQSPTKGRVIDMGKENIKPAGPRRGMVTERALLKGKPILTDIFNDIVGRGPD